MDTFSRVGLLTRAVWRQPALKARAAFRAAVKRRNDVPLQINGERIDRMAQKQYGGIPWPIKKSNAKKNYSVSASAAKNV